MRVVILSQFFPPEPARISRDLANGLLDAGHQVFVLTGYPNYPSGQLANGYSQKRKETIREGRTLVRRVALYPSHEPNALKRFANYLSFAASSTVSGWDLLRSADVVYVYGSPATAAMGAILARILRRVPFVFHVQDLWPDSVVNSGFVSSIGLSRLVAWSLTRWCNLIYKFSARVVTIAPTMQQTLEQRGVPFTKIKTVLNWAEEGSGPEMHRREEFRSKFGLSPDDFVIMYAGNLGPYQGLDEAIRALAQFREPHAIRLVFVGSGVAKERLRALTTELKLDHRVVFAGRFEAVDMPSVAAAADVQLVSLRSLPFFFGTIPGKFPSILASGQPMICAVPGDAGRFVDEFGSGWSTDCNAEGLAGAFHQAYESRSELTQIGARGVIGYKEHFSKEHGITQLVAILAQVAVIRKRTADWRK